MFRKLRVRLIISHALPVIVLTPIISLVLLYLLESHYSLGNLADRLVSQGTLIADFTQDDKSAWADSATAQQVMGRMDPGDSMRIMLIDKNGQLLSSSLSSDNTRIGQTIKFPVIQQALQGETNWQVGYSPFMHSRVLDMGMPVLDDSGSLLGVVRLSYDITEFEQQTVPLVWLVIITIISGTTIALLLGFLLSRSLSLPLSRLTKAVQQLSPNSKPLLLPETGPDEVRNLALNYNRMVDRLHDMEIGRRQLLANIIHELGTPLGAIKAAAQALENGAVSDSQLASEFAIGINSQVDQLRLLIDDLTLLSETEIRDLVLHRQLVNLGDLIQVQCQSYTYLVKQKQIDLICQLASDLPPVMADANRVCQILTNLLHNAYKFTPSHGQIIVTAELQDSGAAQACVEIRVTDSGPGIAVEEQQKIFELLYRSPHHRNLYKGMGIGLALSKRLAEAHGGSLSVDSQPNHGSSFIVRLPVVPFN